MAGDVIEMSSVKAQLGQACMAAAAAELATMQAVKPLVDQIAADSAAGKLATPEEYLNAFPHLFKPAPTSTRSPGNNTQQRNPMMINPPSILTCQRRHTAPTRSIGSLHGLPWPPIHRPVPPVWLKFNQRTLTPPRS